MSLPRAWWCIRTYVVAWFWVNKSSNVWFWKHYIINTFLYKGSLKCMIKLHENYTSNYCYQYQQHKFPKLMMCDKELKNICCIGIAHTRYPFKTYWQLKTDYNHYQYNSSLNMWNLTWQIFYGPKHFIRICNKYKPYTHYKTNLYITYYVLCIERIHIRILDNLEHIPCIF